MSKLLKLEIRKLKKQKSFYISTIVMIALSFMSTMTAKLMTNGNPDLAVGIDYMISAVSNSSFILIVGIFVAILICDDYEQQTIKNIYSRGFSRSQVYFSKLVSVWAAATIMFTLVVLSALAFGSIYFGFGEADGYKVIGTIFVQYVTSMAYVSLFFAISAVLRKTGSSIAATIVAPMIVNMFLSMMDTFLKLKDFSATNLWLSSFSNDVSTMMVSSDRMIFILVVSLIYIPLFVMAGMFFNKKIEL